MEAWICVFKDTVINCILVNNGIVNDGVGGIGGVNGDFFNDWFGDGFDDGVNWL